MKNQIVRMLPSLEAAEQARKDLLVDGFDGDGIHVTVTADEAGPTAGNFYVGDPPQVEGGSDYQHVFKPAKPEELCMMVVTVADPSRLERAAAILGQNGAFDADPADKPPGRAPQAY